MTHPLIALSSPVAEALAQGRPVVAVESAVIDSALPFPENLELLREVCAALEDGGAVPAVLALLDGRIQVGLEKADLERLAQAEKRMKVSRRDLPAAIATGAAGATTVASSIWIAQRVGIRVFLTGAIGGVHRGFAETLDVSADLEELASADVIAICGGAKPILDVPKTLEMLETKGVPVIGWRCDGFPLYFAESSLPIDLRLDEAAAVARLARAKWSLGLKGGVLLAAPPPAEVALPAAEVERLVEEAQAAAEREGIAGGAVTPYLLKAISAATAGRTTEIRRAVLLANAAVAAAVAEAWSSGRASEEAP